MLASCNANEILHRWDVIELVRKTVHKRYCVPDGKCGALRKDHSSKGILILDVVSMMRNLFKMLVCRKRRIGYQHQVLVEQLASWVDPRVL
eukprot:XP_001704802.1 Hypothetical protein GL50803_38625 [Giardia lamblia ATCC 50803]